nr:MAG TPA: hypothetical protein [Caudoviricetes sp.]
MASSGSFVRSFSLSRLSIVLPPRPARLFRCGGRRRRSIQHRPVPLHHIRVVGLDRKLDTSLIKPASIAHAVVRNKLHAASHFLTLECSSRKVELNNTLSVHKDFKSISLRNPENNIRVKCNVLLGRRPVFFEGHLGPGLGQVEREVITFLLVRLGTELGISCHMMECTDHRSISLDRQVISYQLGHLLPQ